MATSKSSSSMRGLSFHFPPTASFQDVLSGPDYPYASSGGSQRSMSHPPGPSVLPSSALGQLRGVDPETTRPRRRQSQGSRRQNKLRVRRETLPSISETRSSMASELDQSIDLSFAASTSSNYGVGGHEPSYGHDTGYLPSSHRWVFSGHPCRSVASDHD